MALRITAVGACALALALAGAAPSTRAQEPIDPATLLKRFEPVLLFHPQEDWAPERADAFVSRARVEKQVTRNAWSSVPKPLPTNTRGCAFTPCYRMNLPCSLQSGDECYEKMSATITDWKRPVIYGRVLTVPSGTPPPPGFTAPRFLVRYWLFYEFDDSVDRTRASLAGARRRLGEHHRRDLSTLQPLFAAYSQHCTGTIRPWAPVEKRAGTHPVAYVGLGSHANYFTNAPTSTKFRMPAQVPRPARARARDGDRQGDGGAPRRSDGNSARFRRPGPPQNNAARADRAEQPLPEWASFPGRWSEGQLLWVGRTPHRFTRIMETGGPATPNWDGTSFPSYWHATVELAHADVLRGESDARPARELDSAPVASGIARADAWSFGRRR